VHFWLTEAKVGLIAVEMETEANFLFLSEEGKWKTPDVTIGRDEEESVAVRECS
jgi:hypothetical protein